MTPESTPPERGAAGARRAGASRRRMLGTLSLALATVTFCSAPYLLRLAWDPWRERWLIPGRSLLVVLAQLLPVAVCWWGGLAAVFARGRTPTRTALAGALSLGLLLFLSIDSSSVVLAGRHLFAAGQARFVLGDGALGASRIAEPGQLLVLLLVQAALAGAVVRLAARGGPSRRALLLAVPASLGLALATGVLAVRGKTGPDQQLYLAAARSGPLSWLGDRVRGSAFQGITGKDGESPLRTSPLAAAEGFELAQAKGGRNDSWQAAGMLVRPRVIVVILFDGWRHDSLGAEATPALWRLASTHGVTRDRHYSSYPGTDRAVYSLLYERHPLFADRDLRRWPSPSPLVAALKRYGYELHAFQTDPHSYRFLADLYRLNFDHCVLGDGDANVPLADAALLASMAQLIDERAPQQPLFLFALLHSTHYPFAGERFSAPRESYRRAVRSLDSAAAAFLERLAGSQRSWLAVVSSDHGTELGECGRMGYSEANSRTLHVPLLALGSPEVAPALLRLRALGSRLSTHQDLASLLLAPEPWFRSRLAAWPEMNVALPGGAFPENAPLVLHDAEQQRVTLRRGHHQIAGFCGSFDSCEPELEAVKCGTEIWERSARVLSALAEPSGRSATSQNRLTAPRAP